MIGQGQDNPWNIQSIYDLQYFNCPSCVFKDNSKQEFIDHVYEIHPDSLEFLLKINDDSLADIIFPYIKEENTEEPVIVKISKDSLKIDKSDIKLFKSCYSKPDYETIKFSNKDIADNETKEVKDIRSPGEIQIVNEEIVDNDNDFDNEDGFNESLYNQSEMNKKQENDFDTYPKKLKNPKCQKSCSKTSCSERVNEVKKHDSEICNKSSIKIKSHNCSFCNKVYNRPQKLKDHIKSFHEGIKDHICGKCGKAFCTSGYLKIHVENVHEGIKHNCSFCNKAFNLPQKLKEHINSFHELGIDHKCEKCGKAFSDTRNLTRHISTVHEGLKNFKCETCDKSYTSEHNLKLHISSVHEGKAI